MSDITVADGTIHTVPDDLKDVLVSNPKILTKWNNLTLLARNEWICWVTKVKKPETRTAHITRLQKEISEGKRRPCCWPGCPHHRPKAMKWFKQKD